MGAPGWPETVWCPTCEKDVRVFAPVALTLPPYRHLFTVDATKDWRCTRCPYPESDLTHHVPPGTPTGKGS